MEHKIKCLEELFPEYLMDLQNSVGLEATGISDAYNNCFKVETGYSCEFIRDFNKGTLTLVGGRPSMGKTSFAINLATRASLSHYNSVALFIKELSMNEILTRILASEEKIDTVCLQNGKTSKEELERIQTATGKISTMDLSMDDDVYVRTPTSLFIDNSYYNSSSDIFKKCSQIKDDTGKLDLVILDDIDLLILKKDEEHLNASMVLKQLSRELDVPIIATCGLTKDRIENANNKRPFLTDLRPPAFQEHADSVILLHRDAYYDLTVENNALELIVNKNVPGKPTGTIRFSWEPKYLRMDEIKQEVI